MTDGLLEDCDEESEKEAGEADGSGRLSSVPRSRYDRLLGVAAAAACRSGARCEGWIIQQRLGELRETESELVRAVEHRVAFCHRRPITSVHLHLESNRIRFITPAVYYLL